MKLTAEQRLSILDSWDKARAGGVAMGFPIRQVDEQLGIVLEAKGWGRTRTTLYNWRERYRRDGLKGLEDGRSQRAFKDRSDDLFLKEARRLRCAGNVPLSIRECHRLAAHRASAEGWTQHNFWTTARYLRACGLGGQKASRWWRSNGDQRPFEGR